MTPTLLISLSGLGPASWVEMIWTVAGGLGAFKGFGLLMDAMDDQRFNEREKINGIRKIAAEDTMRTERLLFGVLVSFFAIGLFAMTQEPSNPNQPITPVGLFITVVFVGVSIWINFEGVRRRRSRTEIARKVAQLEVAANAKTMAFERWDGETERRRSPG